MQLRHLANRALPLSGAEAPAQASPAVQRPTTPPAAATAAAPGHHSATVATPGPAAQAHAEQGPDAALVLASIGELVYDWDLTTDRLNWGPNLVTVLGDVANTDLSTGIAYGERLSPESSGSRYDAIVNADDDDEGDGVPYEATYALAPPRDGGGESPIWIEDQGRWFKGSDGRPARAHGVIRVVTRRHEEERDLAIRSRVDPLTGALNRAHVADHIQRYIKLSERTRKPFALLLVALENLFALNRTYGYDAGDDVIAGLAARLRANVRVNDLVARHAGNKFAIVLDNCDSDEMRAVAMRLIECVTLAPFDTAAGPVPATIRIGGVVAPREGRTINSLAQRAEEALDVARQRAGARFVPYTASLAREDSRLSALRIDRKSVV
jgi:diguanylate cyclase (GGDEF)-like protein